MNIRPVNSEQAYDEAIERIEALSGVPSQILPKGMNSMSCSHWLGYTKKRTIPFPPQLLLRRLALLWIKGA